MLGIVFTWPSEHWSSRGSILDVAGETDFLFIEKNPQALLLAALFPVTAVKFTLIGWLCIVGMVVLPYFQLNVVWLESYGKNLYFKNTGDLEGLEGNIEERLV